jgi:hypothetical protein
MLGTVLGRCGGSSGRTRTQNGNNTLTIKAAKLAAIYSGCKTGRVCVLFGSNRCFDALAVCLRRLLLLSPIAMVTSRLFYNVFCHRRCCFRGTTTPRLEKIEKKTIKNQFFTVESGTGAAAGRGPGGRFGWRAGTAHGGEGKKLGFCFPAPGLFSDVRRLLNKRDEIRRPLLS